MAALLPVDARPPDSAGAVVSWVPPSLPCNDREEAYARAFVMFRNKGRAYREAFGLTLDTASHMHYGKAVEMSRRPCVIARVREIESAAAVANHLDVAALMQADMEIVQAARYADHLSEHVHYNCRHCWGSGFKYQWRDDEEYMVAVAKAMDDAATRASAQRDRKMAESPAAMPSDDGGYGFDGKRDPHPDCPQCLGHGTERTILHDTRFLSGPAAALYRGVKTTAAGTELLLHDVDKAKERLYKAAGAFGDSAAAVARGAAAGAAAGSAIAAAERMQSMTAENAARLYLQVANS